MNNQIIVDICKCDVQDKELLAHFRKKRAEWKRCLIDDTLSISNQITHLLWNDIVFRAFNEARKLSSADKTGDIGLNGPVINLLDEGFVASQIMSIRRLSDPNFLDPKKAVISLRRLIDDIADNLDIFTRENYICFEGTAYAVPSNDNKNNTWLHWQTKQKNFDHLSGVTETNRSRKDTIKKDVISSLRSDLDKCKDLRSYANKFIAHTSDNFGRAKLTDSQKRITLEKLDEAYKSLVKVGTFLVNEVLYTEPINGIPIPLHDQFLNLDKPVIKSNDISKLSNYWAKRVNEVEFWTSVPMAVGKWNKP